MSHPRNQTPDPRPRSVAPGGPVHPAAARTATAGRPDGTVHPDGTVDLADGTASAWTWPLRVLGFALWYAWALVTSSGAVLHDLITPGDQARPGIARVRSNCRTDLEVTVLSSLITLTPGTLTMGTRREGARGDEPGDPAARRLLYVHALYFDDADGVRADVHGMERRLLHAMRRKGVA